MIQNKAPHYNEVLEELEQNNILDNVRKINGNVISCRLEENSYGTFEPPAYPNWYVTEVRNQRSFTTFRLQHIA